MIVAKSEELNKYTKKKTAVALGSFDAIHKGHIAIISETVKYAEQNNMLSMVQLFEVPPAVMNGAGAINTLDKRIEIIEALGADIVVVECFDETFKSMEYNDFVCEYLKKHYNSGAVIAGDNYRFGHCARGNAKSLTELCGQCNIDVKIVACLELEGVISSTRIREYIRCGDVEHATALMTRPYSISGEVVRGRSLGNSIDFPTANINIPDGRIIPKDGVYASRVKIGKETFDGITNVGTKPTIECDTRNIETYIKNFDDNLYGKRIEVEFIKRIRDIIKFNSLNELKDQLKQDLKELS